MEPIVYRYGLLAPLDWGEDCEAELKRMNDLWNKLVEIERDNREAYREIVSSETEVAHLEAEQERCKTALAWAREGRSRQRKAARKKKIDTAELDRTIADAREQLKALRPRLKQARADARKRLAPRLARLNEEHKAAVKEARKGSECYWSNYNAVIASYMTARDRAMRTGDELSFRPWTGAGRLVAQIQGGMSPEEMLEGGNFQIAIEPPAEGAWDHPSRGERKRRQRAKVTMVVYTEKRQARTVTWPLRMHRPLPEGSRIKEAVITRRLARRSLRQGELVPVWEWKLSLLVQREVEPPGPRANAACGIDLGWRRMPGGIRVATIMSDGSTAPEFVTLPETFVDGMNYAAELQAREHDMVNAARRMLPDLSDAPASFTVEDLAGLRSAPRVGLRRLHRFYEAWEREAHDWEPQARREVGRYLRFAISAAREAAGLRRRHALFRRNLYLNAAKRIAETYGLIGVEDIDWAELKRRESREGDESPVMRPARAYARMAAPGEFASCLKRQVEKYGARLYAHKGLSTWRCADCGTVFESSVPSELFQRCPGCARHWDQDVNAARNLLSAALDANAAEASGDGEALADGKDSARQSSKPSRWARAHEALAAKERANEERSQTR